MLNPHFDPKIYEGLDWDAVIHYNVSNLDDATLSKADRDNYELHLDMGPQPFDGDIERATVVLLMHNPGYSEDHLKSREDDHTFYREGWPLSALHPEAGAGNRTWYMQRIGLLVAEFGAQRVSQRLAVLQMNPWASKKFDKRLRLPSRALQMQLGQRALARGAILIAGFGTRDWARGLGIEEGQLPHGNSSMTPYLTPKNLDKHDGLWDRIRTAMGAKL